MLQIQLNIGLTPSLHELMLRLLDAADKHKFAIPATAGEIKPQEQTKEEPKATAAKAAEEATTEAPTEAKSQEAQPIKKAYSDADLREEMHKIRLRIEGEDYATNKQRKEVKLYHAKLTALFKRIALQYGADKPTLIAAESSKAFVDCLQGIIIDGDEVVQAIPF